MSTTKKVIVLVTFLLFVLMLGLSLYTYILMETLYATSLLSVFVTLAIFLNTLNFTDKVGGKMNDELTQHVKNQSGKIGYIVLMLLVAFIFIVSENVFTTSLNDIQNYPLLIVVGLSLVVLPLTEFLYSLKYR